MKINLETTELGEISDIHTKLLRVSIYKILIIMDLESVSLLARLDLNFPREMVCHKLPKEKVAFSQLKELFTVI